MLKRQLLGEKEEPNPKLCQAVPSRAIQLQKRLCQDRKVVSQFHPILLSTGKHHTTWGRAMGRGGSGVNKHSSCKSGLQCVNGKHCTACEPALARRKLCRGLKKDKWWKIRERKGSADVQCDVQRSCWVAIWSPGLLWWVQAALEHLCISSHSFSVFKLRRARMHLLELANCL